jgi:hypothetical protein
MRVVYSDCSKCSAINAKLPVIPLRPIAGRGG